MYNAIYEVNYSEVMEDCQWEKEGAISLRSPELESMNKHFGSQVNILKQWRRRG